jgi:hypothetical protein
VFLIQFFQGINETQLKVLETKSYAPLSEFLLSIGESSLVVGNGKNLPNGLLFNVAVHSMRKSVNIRSAELRKTGEEPKHVFNLTGRTDLITFLPGKTIPSRMNTRYAIAIKAKGFNLSEALKEAYLQLVGLSVDNNNTSPPVILTDLDKNHFVLCFEPEDLVLLKFKLCIVQFPTLVMCIQRCRALANKPCFTARFGSPPTPSPSMLEGSDGFQDDEECEDEMVGHCILEDP